MSVSYIEGPVRGAFEKEKEKTMAKKNKTKKLPTFDSLKKFLKAYESGKLPVKKVDVYIDTGNVYLETCLTKKQAKEYGTYAEALEPYRHVFFQLGADEFVFAALKALGVRTKSTGYRRPVNA